MSTRTRVLQVATRTRSMVAAARGIVTSADLPLRAFDGRFVS